MKKYLMMCAAALAISATFTGCSKEDAKYINFGELSNEQKYEELFNATFGKPASNQTWGFEDQKRYTFDKNGNLVLRGNNANNNMWGSYVEVPKPLTPAQIDVVTKWFSENKNPQGIAVNFSDFFAQQVSSTDYGRNMDHLVCGDNDEHIGNFNNGDNGTKDPVLYADGTQGKDKINFMTNSSTSRFGYHNSLEDGNENPTHYYYNYVIIPGDRIDPSVAGMFFVAFDFQCHGTTDEKKIDADGYFNDWIIKITPGLYTEGQRVFVEDLIAGLDDLNDPNGVKVSDWDFNDAVFDVRFETVWDGYQGKMVNQAVIVLRAAGGILPLTIGGVDVNKMLGSMVNTEKNGKAVTPAIFRIETNVTNAADIPVFVNGTTELKATTGAATQKMAAPIGTPWCLEKAFIVNAYPKFRDWVKNPDVTWYETVNNDYIY